MGQSNEPIETELDLLDEECTHEPCHEDRTAGYGDCCSACTH